MIQTHSSELTEVYIMQTIYGSSFRDTVLYSQCTVFDQLHSNNMLHSLNIC